MIIKKTAFCSKTTCCPTISIDTDSNTVTLTDDFDGVAVMKRGVFLSANFFAQKLKEKRLDVSVSATFYELEYTVTIENRDEVYYLTIEHQSQKVKDITLEQWLILADTVFESYEPSFIVDGELREATI